ncbi:MAG: thioredoxin family protein [Ilumatobacteraceae bacterium]
MQFLVAAILIAVVATAALVLQRKRQIDPPTQTKYSAPDQLDRNDFDGADRDWLVVTFTSATCETCADIKRKAAVLASRDVAVVDAEYSTNRTLHQRYRIEAVPTLVIADREGVVRASFLGPVSATDLWAAAAEARDPGSSPEPGLGQSPG